MTEQQMEMIKRLSDKYKISAESIDKTLLLLGAGYGLNETQIEEYLSMGDGKLMEKHLCMLSMYDDVECCCYGKLMKSKLGLGGAVHYLYFLCMNIFAIALLSSSFGIIASNIAQLYQNNKYIEAFYKIIDIIPDEKKMY